MHYSGTKDATPRLPLPQTRPAAPACGDAVDFANGQPPFAIIAEAKKPPKPKEAPWIPTSVPTTWQRINTPELAAAFIEEQVAAIREQVGDGKVLLALSGGVDSSSVVAALLIKAIGKNLVCVHVNHGLMRKGESEQVIDVFENQMDANLVYVDATDRFLEPAGRRGRARGQAQDHRRASSSACSRRRPAR